MKLNAFQKAIEAKVKQVQEGSLEAVKDINFEIGYRIIARTPVDTGAARNNWNSNLESNDRTIQEADPSGQGAINRLQATIARMQSLNTRFFFTNNLNYVQYLEYGTSRINASAMVGITLAEFPEIAKRKFYARLATKGGLKNAG